jgi:Protein of unknown function (DUF3887)
MSAEEQWPPEARQQLALVVEGNVAAVLAALRGVDAEQGGLRAPLAVLLAACTAGDAIEDATRFAVTQARAAGHTWHEIGEVLAITRQAAQQRFGDRASQRDASANIALARRASQIIEQIAHGQWAAVTTDWNATMRSGLPVKRLKAVWRQLTTTAGALQGVGRATVKPRGPFRIAEVPLVFEHGPMRARVTFDHDDQVAGLFLLLPVEADSWPTAGG